LLLRHQTPLVDLPGRSDRFAGPHCGSARTSGVPTTIWPRSGSAGAPGNHGQGFPRWMSSGMRSLRRRWC